MNRDALVAALIWAVLTAVGEVLAVTADLFPVAGAEEATVVDNAFRVLVFLAIPVFTFVVVTLVYGVLRFRQPGEPTADGPAIHSRRGVVALWFLVTTALTIVVIIFPGATGLAELRAIASAEPDLVVEVEGLRWAWKVTYPEQGVVTGGELVLPVGERVRFDVTSIDILHSLWIPAFRMKIDAVPGMVTTTYATPDRVGSFTEDTGYRIQCAELCGLGHALMRIPVRVVERAEFEAWLDEQRSGS